MAAVEHSKGFVLRKFHGLLNFVNFVILIFCNPKSLTIFSVSLCSRNRLDNRFALPHPPDIVRALGAALSSAVSRSLTSWAALSLSLPLLLGMTVVVEIPKPKCVQQLPHSAFFFFSGISILI